MKISYNWLSEYIDHQQSPDQIAEILTNTGLEVEEQFQYSNTPAHLADLITGRVEKVEQHPNADKLKVTHVNVNQDELLQIICGAPNIREGQKVVVAPVGTTIQNTKGETLKIKKSKMRGVESVGMIVSEEEIGLSDDHSGVKILPENTPIGESFINQIDTYEDTVLEIGLTPNRSDATSHIGVARDLSAVLDKDIQFPDLTSFKVDKAEHPVSINIHSANKCPRYSGLVINNIKVEESPAWLQNKLKAIGLQPINNIVDITNFVMMEMGHPLHAFDLDKVSGNEINIQSAPKGQTFITLDEEYRTLEGSELMICDSEKPIAMAGIMGGHDSGISGSTSSIFLEGAYFDPITIRRASKRHQLITDASFRFERGADPEITENALKRAAMLIREITGGSIDSDILDKYPNKQEPYNIDLELSYLDTLLGYSIPREKIRQILERLGFIINESTNKKLSLTAPTYRVDVTRPVDVVEEIIRIYSLDAIEVSPTLKANLSYENDLSRQNLQEKLSSYLTSNGFLETINAPFTGAEQAEKFPELAGQNTIPIVNPLSQDQSRLRKSTLLTGLNTLLYNLNRDNSNLRFFEFGRVYWERKNHFYEGNRLSLFLTGHYHEASWYQKSTEVDFYYLKALVQNILEASGVKEWEISDEDPEEFAYNLSYKVNDRWLVDFGSVKPKILKEYDIKQEVFYANFDFDLLYALSRSSETKFSPISKYPAIDRDLSLKLPEEVNFQKIKELVRETETRLLKDIRIFDVYQGDKIEEGYKSYAIRMVFQDENKTLKDKDVDKMMNKIMEKLENKAKAEVRK